MENKKHLSSAQWALLVKGILIGIFATMAVLAILIMTTGISVSTSADAAVNQESVNKLTHLERIISQYYYEPDEIDQSALQESMYKGIMDGLDDPYTVYYTEEEYSELKEDMAGSYEGIGAYLSTDTELDMCTITGVITGTPAEEAGLQAGDIIYMVDGEETQGMDVSLVAAKVRGTEGTDVVLTVYREGESDLREITITRRKVELVLVSGKMLEDNIGYIRLTEFEGQASEQLEQTISELKDEGMEGLILDLRGNPGGDVDVAVSIASRLIPEGLVFYMEDKNGKRAEYETLEGAEPLGLPIVVLIDGTSASASEILASAIQESGAGKLVGTTSYGKGVVQSIYDLKDGTAVKITIANYFTRNGNSINGVGITPDVEVPFDADAYKEDQTDNQLQEALKVLKGSME